MTAASIRSRPGRRAQAAVWSGLAVIIVLCWLYVARLDVGAPSMSHAMGAHPGAAGGAAFRALVAAFVMWAIMMAAMMLPAAALAGRFFMALSSRRGLDAAAVTTPLYIAGYVTCWILFAAPAAFAQWELTRIMILDPMARSTSAALSIAVLVTAGLFQFTAAKDICLSKCRTPLGFLIANWRDGKVGAFILGLRHGAYCVACCWALMAVLFVTGTMSLVWMALLTLLVLVEKMAPPRWQIERAAGTLLILWGFALAVGVSLS